MSSHNSTTELGYWLAFHRIAGLGPVRWHGLLRAFPNLETAWHATAVELRQAGLEERLIAECLEQRRRLNPENLPLEIDRLGLHVMRCLDPEYPELLQQIYAPPPILYYRGQLGWHHSLNVAIVGTRRPTAYGLRATQIIAHELAEQGIRVVSGLALGIDGAAHQACLDGNGQTVGVLANGLDQIYPRAHARLAEAILAGGGQLLSEFPPGTLPFKGNFPQRNRIISGLCQATLVIEAGLKSGALITAAAALEQNREIFALPGQIFSPQSEGPLQLLRHGATPIRSAADILETLGLSPVALPRPTLAQPVTPEEKIIFDLLTHEPLHVDKLVLASRLEINVLLATLTQLELKGLVEHTHTQHYTRHPAARNLNHAETKKS